MEKRRDPLEGFDWVFKSESVNLPPDMEDDSFVRLFGSGPTMHDLDPIAEVEPMHQSEPSFLIQALHEHPRLRRAAIRTGLAMGAIITGVTAAFVTHSSATGIEAMPGQAVIPQSSAPQNHIETSKTPSKKKLRPTVRIDSANMAPVSFSYSASTSPTFIPHTSMPEPTGGETVDATSQPQTSSAPSAPSETCTPSASPSATIIETPSPVTTESPSESPTDIEATSEQTETPQASQSPSLGD